MNNNGREYSCLLFEGDQIITDHLVGSVRMIVNAATGNVVEKIQYDEFGNIISELNENEFIDFTFAGGMYDNDTKLIRFGARDYDATTGRWTSKDPLLFRSGQSNLYEYSLNDPLNFLDSDGMQAIFTGQQIAQQMYINLVRADIIAKEVLQEAQIKAQNLPGGVEGLHNGPADAWRHARWNQRMVNEIDWLTAFLAGVGHEVEGLIAGQPLEEFWMDLLNNSQGRSGECPDKLLKDNKLRILKQPYQNRGKGWYPW